MEKWCWRSALRLKTNTKLSTLFFIRPVKITPTSFINIIHQVAEKAPPDNSIDFHQKPDLPESEARTAGKEKILWGMG